MTLERDKFLTEAIGECWHEWNDGCTWHTCKKCAFYAYPENVSEHNISFSTWEGFGKLWEWAQKHSWFYTLILNKSWTECCDEFTCSNTLIDPDNFADAIYAYLKEKAND